MSQNIHYDSDNISEFYRQNRLSWDQFYPSEKNVLEYINPNEKFSVLDIGCGCGGLGIALKERFKIINYTGIEINKLASETAKLLNKNGNFICADFLDISSKLGNFNLVCSLSCIDWNIEFESMLKNAWSLVTHQGYLLISLRLTKEYTLININKSYQYINYEGQKKGEKAPYCVLEVNDWISNIKDLYDLESVYGYGYYGKPSDSAVTPFNEICFAVFALKKSNHLTQESIIKYELDIPIKSFIKNLG